MITIKHGNIFDSTADVLVCPVNCVGVMGKGLALEFKRRFPEMFRYYKGLCTKGWISPGSAKLITKNTAIFATKDDWRNPSKIEWVEKGLAAIANCNCWEYSSIALPQLGCGCGGLDWVDVWPLYEKHLGDLPCNVEVWIHE
jgi:O-acetyl-ADP-ribose deacetylase (regulator of RNase III)